MTPPAPQQPHWLSRYATGYHTWRTITSHSGTSNGSRTLYKRPLGLAESGFNTDGVDYGGRADVNNTLQASVRCGGSSDPAAVRKHILLAWTCLRIAHPMLGARSYREDGVSGKRWFVVEQPGSVEEAIEMAGTGAERDSLVFVEDFYPGGVDGEDFYMHSQNAGRVIEPDRGLGRLFVLSTKRLPSSKNRGDGDDEDIKYRIHLLLITAHEIADGLSMYNWVSHLLRLLDTPTPHLIAQLSTHIVPSTLSSRLPPAQEDHFPPIPGNPARQRWFWAIVRILRHVRRPATSGFPNPLYNRSNPQTQTIQMPPKYPALLNYSPSFIPPLNTFITHTTLSPLATARLIALCRASKCSVGAGLFTLVGMSMMALYELDQPDIPLAERQPFVASFPVNPRPFIGYRDAESCMLIFSDDGVVLPFLPASLDVQGRFRLLVRSAHRQLGRFQKQSKQNGGSNGDENAIPPATRLLAHQYLNLLDMDAFKRPSHLHQRDQHSIHNPQGAYPAAPRGQATCGVSSVGDIRNLFPAENGVGTSMLGGPRARGGEFLVGSSTRVGGAHFSVSFDGNAVDRDLVGRWKGVIGALLEGEWHGYGEGKGVKGRL
ncbi:hypothetical protein FQN52_006187 [Onygenales sp. PD_12]|nr:hypothetical protein FQN53_002328 [Emmonsiellopsis sp. PD_33]KAK2795257.1 hypothetical protein FQN52_006187 [Onygenales sp. PD_12]KAK2807678.1 hypothetical protein FQN51_000115 [Onygenales sp. PD_10]